MIEPQDHGSQVVPVRLVGIEPGPQPALPHRNGPGAAAGPISLVHLRPLRFPLGRTLGVVGLQGVAASPGVLCRRGKPRRGGPYRLLGRFWGWLGGFVPELLWADSERCYQDSREGYAG